MTFWPFIVVTMGVAPLAQYTLGLFPRDDPGLAAYYPNAQLLVLTGGALHALFYFRTKLGVEASPTSDFRSRPNASRSANRRLLAAVCLAVMSFPLSLASGTSLASRFQSRDELISAYSQAGIAYAEGQSIQLALLKTLPTALAVVAAMLVTFEIARRRESNVQGTHLAVGVVPAAASFAVFANPLSNGRFAAFGAVLAVVFCASKLQTRTARLALSAALLLGLMTIYPAAAAFKNDAAGSRVESGAAAFATVDFDGMQQTANALYYVETVGTTDGRVLSSAILFFVPRALWPEKSMPSSYLTTEVRGYGPLNLSQPLWSEFYLDFSVPGALLILALLGRKSAQIDRRFLESGSSMAVILAASLASVQVGFLRGPMGAIMVYSVAVVGLAVVTAWWSERDHRRPINSAYRSVSNDTLR